MKIVIVDGQGGGIGKEIVRLLKQKAPKLPVLAVGINALATAAMLKAGADAGVSGDNAAVFNAADADIIAGPIGIILPNAMMGEVSPAVAQAIAGSKGKKVLVPVNKCSVRIAGTGEKPAAKYVEEAVCSILEEIGYAQ